MKSWREKFGNAARKVRDSLLPTQGINVDRLGAFRTNEVVDIANGATVYFEARRVLPDMDKWEIVEKLVTGTPFEPVRLKSGGDFSLEQAIYWTLYWERNLPSTFTMKNDNYQNREKNSLSSLMSNQPHALEVVEALQKAFPSKTFYWETTPLPGTTGEFLKGLPARPVSSSAAQPQSGSHRPKDPGQ